MANDIKLADMLGWFSLGLGLTAVANPRGVTRFLGVPDDDAHREVVMAVGLREIASGLGLLTSPNPSGWLWARAAGDIMDLSLLSAALTANNAQRGRVALATAAVAGITAVDFMASQQAGRQNGISQLTNNNEDISAIEGKREGMKTIQQSIVIDRPAQELYTFWRNFENLPQIMKHVESVQVREGGRLSHWQVSAPVGTSVAWDAELVEDQPGQRIAWRSLENADIKNAGTVQFTPTTAGHGTTVQVTLEYAPPAGELGVAVAKLFGEEPEIQAEEDLQRFKQIMENGGVVRSTRDNSPEIEPLPAG